MITMASGFVILLHRGHGATHFDLMLEQADGLATWQLAQDPAALAVGGRLPARRLADHRKAYLVHEGPVGGGRGSVQRIHAGSCQLLHAEDTRLQFRLEGPTCGGTFELTKEAHGDGGEDGVGGEGSEGGNWWITRVR
jgi:hypothetical protein